MTRIRVKRQVRVCSGLPDHGTRTEQEPRRRQVAQDPGPARERKVFMAELPEHARELFDGPHHVVVSTIDPDGRPQSSVVWARADGDDVLFSTIKGRRKYANLTRDPRLSVLVFDPADPYAYAEVRGTATVTDDPAAELINT